MLIWMASRPGGRWMIVFLAAVMVVLALTTEPEAPRPYEPPAPCHTRVTDGRGHGEKASSGECRRLRARASQRRESGKAADR
jgi:hypothetical protein